MNRDRRLEGGRAGSVLMTLGIFGILGVTFVIGVTVGRSWSTHAGPLARVGPRAESPAPAPRAASPPAGRAVPTPPLTFYEELTAPLRPAPVVVRGASPERAPSATRPPAVSEPARPGPAATGVPEGGAPRGPAEAEGRFTVQVGAFIDRAAAESLRTRLVREGHQAYVVRVGGRAPYRVRVGAFDSAPAARRVADRLGADRRLRPFVTRR